MRIIDRMLWTNRKIPEICGLRLITCFVAGLLLLSSVNGCKKASGTVPVHGKVSFHGAPLKTASITFFPVTGRAVPASITDGEYSTELTPGEFTVALSLGIELPPGFKEGDPIPPAKTALPDEYTVRAKSTLKATVKADQDQPIDFDLK